MAWLSGLKTTYYLRALGATSTEKSTVEGSKLNAVSAKSEAAPAPAAAAPTPMADTAPDLSAGPAPVPMACSLDDPDCEACQ